MGIAMDGQTDQPLQNNTDQDEQADPLPKKKIRKYFFLILVVGLIFGATAIFLQILLNYPGFQRYLIQRLSQASPYNVETGKIRIHYRDGLEIQVKNLVARSKQTSHRFEAAQIELGFQYNTLLNGRFFPEKVIIQDGRFEFRTNQKENGAFPPDRLSKFQSRIQPLLFDSRRVELNNITIINTNSKYALKNLNVHIQPPADDPRQRRVQIIGHIIAGDAIAPFQLIGDVSHPSGVSERPAVVFDVQVRDVPLAHFPWPKQVQFGAGLASGNFHITGPDKNRLDITGNVSGDALRFAVNRNGRSKHYVLSQAKIDFDGDLGLGDGRIEKMMIRTPEAEVGVQLLLNWQNPSNIGLDLDINSKPLPLPVFKKIFPTPLVPPWIEAKLFPLFSGGTARLDRLRLNGSIDNMKKIKHPENADVFEMRLTLDKMNAFTNNPDLAVTDVNGEVVIHQGQLLVNGVKGYFGRSALTEGTLFWPSLYNQSRRYTLGIRGDFDLGDLKRQGVQPILPAVIRREIDRIKSAGGPMTADIALSFPGKKQLPVLTGMMAFKNSRIHHTTLSLPIDLLNGRLLFSEKGAVQVDATGRWGDSDINVSGTTGALWRADGPVRRPLLNLDIDADIDLSDLLTLRQLAILPVGWRKPLTGIKTIEGRMGADVALDRKTLKNTIRLTGSLTTDGARMTHTAIKLPLDIRVGKMAFGTAGNSGFSATGAWGRSSFNAEGTADLQQKSMQVTLATKADINELIDHYHPQNRSRIRLNQPLPGRIQIQKTADRWSFAGEADLDSQVITLPTLVIAPPNSGNRLIFDMGYSPGQWVLNSCRFLGKTSRFTLKGARGVKSGSPLSIEMTADPLDLIDMGFRMTGGTAGKRQIEGKLTGHIKSEIPSSLGKTEVNGALTLDGVLFGEPAGSLPYQADLRFKGREIDIVNFIFPVGQYKGSLKGRLTGWDRWRGRLDLDLDCIDLPHLIDQLRNASTGGQAPLSGLLANAEINMAVRANQVIWETIDLGNFSAALQYQDDRLRIENALFTAPSSLIKLSGSLSGRHHKTLSLLTYFKLDQQPLADILQGLHLSTERMNGTLTLEGGLALRGRNKTEIIQNLAGKLNIKVTEGIVQKSNVIVKILDFLSIQNIFLRRPPDILKSRFYFENIQGHVTIEKGQFNTERLFMKSPVFNAAARGSYDLPQKELDFLVGVQALNTIDRIISKIPIIGHILTGKKKTILVYYFKIKGQPNQVIVKHVPFNNLDEAILGYFKRLFLTPTRLWTKISSTLEEINRSIRSGTTTPHQIDPSTIGP